MDQVDEAEPSRGGRRALPLIAAALAFSVIAGLIYLRASSPRAPVAGQLALKPFQMGGFLPYYDFVSPSVGWAVVEEQEPIFWIFKTSDGAQHWERQYTGVGLPGPVRVRFFDAEHGIVGVLSSSSVLVRTDDGGLHWQGTRLPADTVWLAFADITHGWALVAPNPYGYPQGLQLFATVDGGGTWVERQWPSRATPFANRSWFDLHFRADGEGWIGASEERPYVLLTLDGGGSWQQRVLQVGETQRPGSYATEVNLLPGDGVIAFLTDPLGSHRAFTSFDRGESWRPAKPPPDPATFEDIAYGDARHWWAMKAGILYKSADAGQSWTRVRESQSWNPSLVGVIDAKHAWSVRIFSTARYPITGLVMTSDGGVNWVAVNVPNLNYSQ